MKNVTLSLLLICSLIFIGCGSSTDTAPPIITPSWVAPDPNQFSQELQSEVLAIMQANQIPAALVTVSTPRGTFRLAQGVADLSTDRAATMNDHSGWRSVTKSFTVTVVMQLAAEGLIELDAPISRYLNDVPNGDRITPRHLANMTSGLVDYSGTDEFLQLFAQDFKQAFTTDELLGFAFAKGVKFQPGEQYDYSNTNTVVLEKLAETVTGTSLPQLISARLLTPLGMRNTVYLTGFTLPAPDLKGYEFDSQVQDFEEILLNGTALAGAGAMAGTSADLAVWGNALVSGALLPTELQVQRFVSRAPENGPRYDSYGMGMGEIRDWWGHTGFGLGYQACVFSEPNTGSTVVILLNATNENHDVPADLFEEILDTLGWPARDS